MSTLVLASTSAARAALLSAAGVDFDIEDPHVDEADLKRRLMARTDSPRDIAQSLAEAKALAVSAPRQQWVIGADQTLDLDGVMFDKARNLADAHSRLLKLRGVTHRLHAGVALAKEGTVIWRHAATASLTMRPFTDSFLDRYLARNAQAALGAVGGYYLEGEGAQLFERIEGDYFAILGLPLLELLGALRQHGIISR